MSAISDILSQIPIGQLASQVGASQADTKTAATAAIQSLLGGMSANVADGGGAALTSALQDHNPGKTSQTKTSTAKTGAKTTPAKTPAKTGVDLTGVDTADGANIVKHVLGTDAKSAAAAVADKTGTDSTLLSKLLPILAPIVMTYLASKLTGGSAGKTAVASGIGGLVGSMLGGGTSQADESSGIGDLLGNLLGKSMGSGNSASGAGGLGNLLGNLF